MNLSTKAPLGPWMDDAENREEVFDMTWNSSIRPVLLSAGLALLLVGSSGVVRGEAWYDPPIITSYANHYRGLVAGDLDRDGLTDVVLKGYPQYYVYFMQPDGHLVAGDSLDGTNGDQTHALLDEDRDGWLDLIGLANGSFRIWHNDHTGHFTDTGRTLSGVPPIVVGDLDADGLDDVITAAPAYGVDVYYGTTSGLSATLQYIDFTDETVENLISISAMRIADLDGNGHPDLIAAGYYQDLQIRQWSRIWWRLSTDARSFQPVNWFSTNVQNSSYGALDLTDLDGDSDLDIACRYSGERWTIDILRYDSLGDQLQVESSALGQGDPVFIRLDDDPFQDLVAGRSSGARTRVYRGLGNGEFSMVQELHGAWVCGLGTAVTPSGKDILAAGYGSLGEPTIAVWPWHYLAMDVEETALPTDLDIRIGPRVVSDAVRFVRRGSLSEPTTTQIVDLGGRVVRTLQLDGVETSWDLRDSEGIQVPSGMYWVRLTSPAGITSGGHVCVLR
jgi:hypothetical protein